MRNDLPAPAFRLWTLLPVRTHEWQPKATPFRQRTASMSEAKVQRARELEAKGMTRREISYTLGVSRSLLSRHLGKAKWGRRKGCKNFDFE